MTARRAHFDRSSDMVLAFYLGEARSSWISGTAVFDCVYIITNL
jgi:hypothetical protein